MIELIEAVGDAALPGFLTALLVFGFAPGFVLRLIVKLYPRDDLRRRELVAELYTIPRLERPLWVAEQVETALFEGLGTRQQLRIQRRAAFRAAVAANPEYRETRKLTRFSVSITLISASLSLRILSTDGILDFPLSIKQIGGIVVSVFLLIATPPMVYVFLRERRALKRRVAGGSTPPD